MKKSILYTLLILLGFSLLGVSCSKGENDDPIIPYPPEVDPDEPTPPYYPTFDSPNWSVEDINSFEFTMTIVAVLPDSLQDSELSTDELSVFAGDECRSVAERIEVSTDKHVWIAMVYGNKTSDTLSFKYYSNKTRYMYQSVLKIPFEIDGIIGTIDTPQTIGMDIVTEE